MSSNEHHACEIRYRDLLGRLGEMSTRVERLERDQRTFFELLRDVRDLIGLVMTRVKASDHRIDEIAARLVPLRGRDERIARHFRN